MASRKRRHEDYPGAAPELIGPAILVEFIICPRTVAEPTESAGLTAREARCTTEAKPQRGDEFAREISSDRDRPHDR